MKVAVIQNKLGIDGRSKVVAEIIKILNKFGINPVIFTFSGSKDITIFRQEYFKQPYFFTHKQILSLPVTRGASYQVILSNIISNHKLRYFDIIINSNNCPYFMPHIGRYIYYFHFPLEAEWIYNSRFYSWKYKGYILPLKIITCCVKPKLNDAIILANSNFTRNVLSQLYGVPLERIQTIYPPAYDEIGWRNIDKSSKGEVDVLSIGAFISDKMQIEQIQIAKECPELTFGIAGQVWSRKYFEMCKQFIIKHKIFNVKLFPNIHWSKLKELLYKAIIFLHSKRYEHFGIATVEAIAAKCIPIVHNSGGQCEIVPIKELRYESKEEAIEKIKWIFKLDNEKRHKIISFLAEHAKNNFSIKMFHTKFEKVFSKWVR